MSIAWVFKHFATFPLRPTGSDCLCFRHTVKMGPKKKPKSDQPPSRRPVLCGVCEKQLERYDRLKSHFEKFHPGLRPYEKGQISLAFSSESEERKRVSNHADPCYHPKRTPEIPLTLLNCPQLIVIKKSSTSTNSRTVLH